jgi:nitronate monooxygenase
MLRTRLCDLLGVVHPIVSAPMGSGAGAELAAAVSEAGGFGLIGMGIREDPAWLREQIKAAKELTERPFGVGFITPLAKPALHRIALDENVAAVSHSFHAAAGIAGYVNDAHEAGVKVIVQAQNLSQVKEAVAAGADAITAQGTEAGGHGGYIGTLSMVAATLDVAGDTPVLAAGGIADGRTFAAMLLMGAEGAWIGTRFIASLEAASAPWVKQRVLEAGADDTLKTKAYDLAMGWPFPEETMADRVLRNEYTDTWHGRNQEVLARRDELKAQIQAASASGDARFVAVRAGNAVSLIDSIEPAGEIVRRLVADAEQVLRTRPGAIMAD